MSVCRLLILCTFFILHFNIYARVNNTSFYDNIGLEEFTNIWVFFKDKPSRNLNSINISSRALKRRRAFNFASPNFADFPVNNNYIEQVKKFDAKLRHIFKWENAVSFTVKVKYIDDIINLPFVKYVKPVRRFRFLSDLGSLQRLNSYNTSHTGYGRSYSQLNIIKIPQLHSYIRQKLKKNPGEGIIIGVFDTGFRLEHNCFNFINNSKSVIAKKDFVDNDTSVSDPDSVKSNRDHPYYGNDEHGSEVLALIAGKDEGEFIGTAWGAKFVLARTENAGELSGGSIELHGEEDNWASAIVWAESIGVDIVSSSVAYRDGFTDSLGNNKPESDYSYSDMDGATTIIARAAKDAVKRGMLIVNSVGNEFNNTPGTLVSPSDVKDVIAVGSIDSDLSLSSFSSTGPTSNGYKKPDLVTLGRSVVVPIPSTYSSYRQLSGTSFSAPVIAGLTALIKQCKNKSSSEEIRNMLYGSCKFLPTQDSIDNYFGRGLPDGLLAVIDTNESYLIVENNVGDPIPDAKIFIDSNLVGISDSVGYFLLSDTKYPTELNIKHDYLKEKLVKIKDKHQGYIARMDSNYTINIRVINGNNESIKFIKVFAKSENEMNFTQYTANEDGVVLIPLENKKYSIYATALGYKTSNINNYEFSNKSEDIIIKLEKRLVNNFAVYPNVISLYDINQNKKINIDFLAEDIIPPSNNQLCLITVRNITGDIIWSFSKYLAIGEPVTNQNGEILSWSCRSKDGRLVTPGVYIVIVRYAGKTFKKKILVTDG